MKQHDFNRFRRLRVARAALTLLELVMVLAILAVLTTVAVQSMGKVAQKSRFDATQRTLENIRNAVFGQQSSAEDSVSGFIADVGRPPVSLVELLEKPIDLPSFAVAPVANSSAADNDVVLARGWRGPYLQLPLGSQSVLLDGWGYDINHPNNRDDSAADHYKTTYDPVSNYLVSVGSFGADNAWQTGISADGFNSEMDLILCDSPSKFVGAMISGTIVPAPGSTKATSNVELRFYCAVDPAEGTGTKFEGVLTQKISVPVDTDGKGSFSVSSATDLQSGTEEFHGQQALRIGPHGICAFSSAVHHGPAKYVTVHPGESLTGVIVEY